MRSPVGTKTKTNIGSYETVISSDTIRTKIENATDGLPYDCFSLLYDRILPVKRENALIICEYILSLRAEINPSNGYRRNNILLLSKFSVYFKNAKLFKEITREDILSFLDSFRKMESVDPLHKWIGTYNLYRIQLMYLFQMVILTGYRAKEETKATYYRKHSPT